MRGIGSCTYCPAGARRPNATSRRGSAGGALHERAQRLSGGWTAGIRCACGCWRPGSAHCPRVPACLWMAVLCIRDRVRRDRTADRCGSGDVAWQAERSTRAYTGRIRAGDLGRLRRQIRSGLNGLWPRTNPDVASWSHTVGVGRCARVAADRMREQGVRTGESRISKAITRRIQHEEV